MARKKNKGKNNPTRRIILDPSTVEKYENPYIGTFEEMLKREGNTIETMIGAVAMINAELLATMGRKNIDEIDETTKEKIIEAYEYTSERMLTSKKNEKKILHNWFGNYPLLFRIGYTFKVLNLRKELESRYRKLSKEKQSNFDKTFQKIWNTREYRKVFFEDGSIEIPKTVYREELDDYKDGLKEGLLDFFEAENGVLVFAHSNDNKKLNGFVKIQEDGKFSDINVSFNQDVIEKYSNSYIGIFDEIMKQCKNTIENMIAAISVIDSEILYSFGDVNPDEIDEKVKEEIAEAFEYISQKIGVSEKNTEKIQKLFKNEYPVLFMAGIVYTREQDYHDINTRYQSLSKAKQFKFNQLFKLMWNVNALRHLTVNEYQIEIPETIDTVEEKDYQFCLTALHI